MLDRVAALLAPREGEVYADATAGLGGHAALIARSIGESGTVILNDLDPANLTRAAARVMDECPRPPRVETILANFASLPHAACFRSGLRANMLLADLGFASTQVDDASRGFSFNKEGPLDMRFSAGSASALSAADLVNGATEGELARIISEFGEERFASRVAKRIVQSRATQPILTTTQLAKIVRGALGAQHGEIDPSTRTFQALRIAVNDELGSLDALLASVLEEARRSRDGVPMAWLAPGARIVFISFHSLEDRRVKHAIARGAKDGTLVPVAGSGPVGASSPLVPGVGGSSGEGDPGVGAELGLDEVAEATPEQIRANPRARSAKVRAARLALPK